MGRPGWDTDAPVPDGIGVFVLCVQLARVARISLDRTGWTWKGWRVGVTRGAVGAAGAEGFDPEESVPPWIPVRLDEVVGLLAAYRLARAEVERIRRGLAGRDGGQERRR